jgi:predicted transposase YbfD/YdcC
VLALKENQGSLREDTELFFAEQRDVNFIDTTVTCHKAVEKSHGRIETRTTTVCNDIGWLQERHNWPGLSSIVMVDYRAEENGQVKKMRRFFISPMSVDAEQMIACIRNHWSIENSLHWVMDMVFRDDECRIGKGNAPDKSKVQLALGRDLLDRLAPAQRFERHRSLKLA